MTATAVPDIRSLYRLPFSKNDNPNGWVEITTHCRMRCPGCYRGCDRDDVPQTHETMEAIRANIDEIVRLRNCQIISLSGGEPLLHPDLDEVVRYIAGRGLSPWLQTSALGLTPERVAGLKRAGLGGIVIRVDSLQPRREHLTERDLNVVRAELARMAGEGPETHLTFIAVVSDRNLAGVPDIVEWARANPALVDFVGFIPLRQVMFHEGDPIDPSGWVYLQDLCRVVAERFPDLRYASFLGGLGEAAAIKWLQSEWVVHEGRVLGYFGPKLVELFQMGHHLVKGRYAYKYGKGRSRISVAAILGLAPFLRELRPVAKNAAKMALGNPVKLLSRASVQVLSYIIPPGPGSRIDDLCEGCPDAILYQGRLVPSCGLEEFKWRSRKALAGKEG
jgi:pyruvate-formate lyase-activating enzyme